MNLTRIADLNKALDHLLHTLKELEKDIKSWTPPQAKPHPLSDEQVIPMFHRRADMKTEGEKDPWFWYAWGVEDGEAAHGITKE